MTESSRHSETAEQSERGDIRASSTGDPLRQEVNQNSPWEPAKEDRLLNDNDWRQQWRFIIAQKLPALFSSEEGDSSANPEHTRIKQEMVTSEYTRIKNDFSDLRSRAAKIDIASLPLKDLEKQLINFKDEYSFLSDRFEKMRSEKLSRNELSRNEIAEMERKTIETRLAIIPLSRSLREQRITEIKEQIDSTNKKAPQEAGRLPRARALSSAEKDLGSDLQEEKNLQEEKRRLEKLLSKGTRPQSEAGPSNG